MRYLTASTVLLLLLVLSTGIMCQAVSDPVDCNKNSRPFLSYLDSLEPGTVSETPLPRTVGGWTVCTRSWGNSTCCDSAKLRIAYKKVVEPIRDSWQNFLNTIVKFKNIAEKLRIAAGGDDSENRAEQVKHNLRGLSKEQAKFIVDRMASIFTLFQNQIYEIDSCFSSTNLLRTNFFCAACQGSQSFFIDQNSNLKANGNFQSNSCIKVWKLMFEMQAGLLIAHEVKRGATGSPPVGIPTLPGIQFGEMYDLFSKCPDGATTPSCSWDELNKIGRIYFNFKRAEPIVVPMNDQDLLVVNSSRLLQTVTEDGTLVAGSATTFFQGEFSEMESIRINAGNSSLSPFPHANNTNWTGVNTTSQFSSNNGGASSGNILMASFVWLVVMAATT